ncbi:MAG: hypothetical protein HY905_02700 [Deltaproteobacteria bacterium]|nr:hypothetical protein [Deltaproteobacteria bacterium]
MGLRPFRLAAVLVVSAAFAAPARPQQPPLRVAVRVASPADAALLERVQGQTSDLDVELLPAPSGPLEPTLAGQLATARTLGEHAGAAVVVWFSAAPADAGNGAILVHVAETAAGRVLARVVGGGSGAGTRDAPDSAASEQAALVVRSTLRALAAGGSLGVEAPTAPATPMAQPEPPAPLSPAAATPPTPEPGRPVSTLGWTAELGWTAVFDGGAASGQHALEARLGLAVPWLRLSACGRAGFAAELPDRWATVELSRHGVGLAADLSLELADGLELLLGVELGAAAWRRSAANAGPGVSLRAARTLWSFALAPEVRLDWRPAALGGVGFVVTVAADWVPSAPRFGYDEDGTFVVAHELSPAQARVGFGVSFSAR